MTGPLPVRQHSQNRRRDYERQERRAAVEILLARLERGAILPAEKALLRQHVAEEQRLSDEARHAANTTTRALAKQREAADGAIRELEAERDRLAAEVARLEREAIARSPMPTRRRRRLEAVSGPQLPTAATT